MGEWKRHGGQAYNCSFFQGDKNKKAAEEVKADLDQFLRYAEHYENHLRSIQCEKQVSLSGHDHFNIFTISVARQSGGQGAAVFKGFWWRRTNN